MHCCCFIPEAADDRRVRCLCVGRRREARYGGEGMAEPYSTVILALVLMLDVGTVQNSGRSKTEAHFLSSCQKTKPTFLPFWPIFKRSTLFGQCSHMKPICFLRCLSSPLEKARFFDNIPKRASERRAKIASTTDLTACWGMSCLLYSIWRNRPWGRPRMCSGEEERVAGGAKQRVGRTVLSRLLLRSGIVRCGTALCQPLAAWRWNSFITTSR